VAKQLKKTTFCHNLASKRPAVLQTCVQAGQGETASLFPPFTGSFTEYLGALGMPPAAQAQTKETVLAQRACRQRRGQGTAGRYWQSRKQSVWQYHFLVTKVQAHQ